MKLSFTIVGNQEDEQGNPIPKAKLTQGQQWTSRAQRYGAWKRHVRASALDAVIAQNKPSWMVVRLTQNQHLFDKDEVVGGRLDIRITWANEAHGDPESIFGSIADSLFAQDKHLVGSISAEHGDAGAVAVDIDVKLISEK